MMLPSPPKRPIPPATHRSILRKWEYKQRFLTASDLREYRNMADFLNEEGKDGWELVQTIVGYMIQAPNIPANYTFIFKREMI